MPQSRAEKEKKEPSGKFRPEIEGVRAIASLLVAVFHIWMHRVSGAVDVFFVVSAFLITTGLSGQIARTGRVQFAVFWGGLIKRLLPAALLVLCAVIITSLVLMPKSRWKDTIEQVGAAAIYLENWLLAYRSVDYLARHEAVSPVQHFWALSVQGQFYVLWPLLFAFGATIARRWEVARRAVLTALLVVLFAASLAFSIHLTAVNQPFAYFHTLARAWEFSIGALLALYLPSIRLPATLRVLMGWIGVLAILSCGVVMQVSRVFPGYAALWPTLAAVLIITAGTTGSRWGVDRILGSRPLVYVGGISYGIYLWHFPILTFCQLVAEPHDITVVTGIAILVSSIALAALTQRFIEGPARYSRIAEHAPARAFAFGAACLAPVGLGLLLWTGLYFHARDTALKRVDGLAAYPGAAAVIPGAALTEEARAIAASKVDVFPGPLSVNNDRDMLDCKLDASPTVATPCVLGDRDGTFTVAVVGGSHSSQWLPALETIAAGPASVRIIALTKSDCPFHLGKSVSDTELDSCGAWNNSVMEQVVRLRPDIVLMTSTRYDNGDEYVPEGYIAAWRRLGEAGIEVVALRDNPDFEFDVSACVELHGADDPLCSLPRARMLETPSPVEALRPLLTHVRFIDLSDYFCDRTTCPPVIGNVLVYRHKNHVTATYVRSLAPMLYRAIQAAVGVSVTPAVARGN